MKLEKWITTLALPTILAGCNTVPSNMPLIFGEHITFGASLGGSTVDQGIDVTVGFKSKDIAIVPLTKDSTVMEMNTSNATLAVSPSKPTTNESTTQPGAEPLAKEQALTLLTQAIRATPDDKLMGVVGSTSSSDSEVVEEYDKDGNLTKRTTKLKPSTGSLSHDAYSVFGQFGSWTEGNTRAVGLRKFFATGSAAVQLSGGFKKCLELGNCSDAGKVSAEAKVNKVADDPTNDEKQKQPTK